ncbi:uracil-xanthine permease family protein [Clostridium argentinense CDC 2741]|uniref:Uracil-xanthine permease family protein n=1 Tax=Clostridium argentinense CDC 2741 TaxID=1418104 RepID=A0A0C1U079_9CLOT|nr:uracil-xanthine permease family protein [Clostridium argentinense]ARC85005.1 uracil permease [Clostridium argentinense]KIE46234.1 uracil-xanthine permease family protein [Clostridium argentinense CDC 2741]NFF40470.1 uracil-xanthine permease [Clostridium argentinense]NFP50544.1 uracil-xanthine permease [Clostridium argentinense]NFP72850.1 uracil-xanthine permease [Clostridium argentinense]
MSQNVITKSNVNSQENKSLLQSAQRFVLAFQHLIAMFGATVLVPILTGFDPSIALIAAGCGTLIFHLCTKGKVPVFLGSSFAFIPVIISVTELHNGDLRYAQGGIMIAGFIYVILSLFVRKVGVNNIKKFLPAQVVGPMIIAIGLNLIPTAYDMASKNLIVAAITLSIALIITLFGKGFIKQLSILLAVTVGYLLALKIGMVNTSLISEAPLFSIPNFTLPKFDLSSIAVIAPVVLAVLMEHVGDITTNGQVVGKNFIEDPGLNRTLLGDGLATMFSAFIGGPANTTYGENTGVLAITKNYDPSIIRLTAILAIVLGVVAKIGGFLQSIPAPVMGGISLMLFSMIALIGVKTIKSEKVEFNIKNVIIMTVILIIGIGTGIIEKKFGFTLGIPVTETVKISGVSLAAITGVILNAIINRKEIK